MGIKQGWDQDQKKSAFLSLSTPYFNKIQFPLQGKSTGTYIFFIDYIQRKSKLGIMGLPVNLAETEEVCLQGRSIRYVHQH